MSYEHLLRPVRNTLLPPGNVRGMKILDREKFRKPLKVYTLLCPKTLLHIVVPKLKPLLLKLEKLKPIRLPESIPETIVERSKDDPLLQNMREIIFNPLKIDSWHNLPVKFLKDKNILPDHFSFDEIELTYDNWGATAILRSVLPLKSEAFKSFSRIGHIVHVNLREHLLPYKQIIGQVLLDKVPNVRTVVNKSAAISNAFRFFDFELLCGEPLFVVETKENRYRYKLDFSTVYWNPRLSTEHQRVSEIIQSNDVLYDVFAGIGPFAVPAASNNVNVFANDLNPESVRWLKHNLESNAKNAGAQVFNLDGAEFIRSVVKPDLMSRWRAQSTNISLGYNMYIVMNLPDTALTFLSEFRGLFENEIDQIQFDLPEFKFPNIFCYTFAKGPTDEAEESIHTKLRDILRMPIENILKDIQFVRNVAPNNNMYRVHLLLNKALLTTIDTIKTSNTVRPNGNVISDDGPTESRSDEVNGQKNKVNTSQNDEVDKEKEKKDEHSSEITDKVQEDKEEELREDENKEKKDKQEQQHVDHSDVSEATKLGKRFKPLNVSSDEKLIKDDDVKNAKKPKPSYPV